MIKKEIAIVYRGGGRRWFTAKAAANAEAREAIKARCECDKGDNVTPGFSCFHHQEDIYLTLKRRLARIAMARFMERKAREKALDELTRLGQEMGDYQFDDQDIASYAAESYEAKP